jgi:hypothetical protein
MKKILLLTVLICLWLTPIFSQLNIHSKIDTTYKNTLITIDLKYFILNSSRNFKSFFDNLNAEM